MSSLFLFVGCLFLLAGVAYLAYLTHVPETYAMGSVIVMGCLAALTGAHGARRSRV